VSGKALASGFSAAPEPVASAIPLSYLFADPRHFAGRLRRRAAEVRMLVLRSVLQISFLAANAGCFLPSSSTRRQQ
jgi:hypothetical protein